MGALIVSLVCLGMLPEAVRGNVLGSCGLTYFILAAVGWATHLGVWMLHLRTKRSDSNHDPAPNLNPIESSRGLPDRSAQFILALGCALTLLAVSVVRETIRLSHIDLDRLYEQHAEAVKVGGLSVFVIFGVVNGFLIAFCIWLVRNATTRRAVPRPGEST